MEEDEIWRLFNEMTELAQQHVGRCWKKRSSSSQAPVSSYPAGSHILGIQAARSTVHVAQYSKRLKRSSSEVRAELIAIHGIHGQVKLKKRKRIRLTPASMPFAPDQRAAVEFAQAALKNKAIFKGCWPETSTRLPAQELLSRRQKLFRGSQEASLQEDRFTIKEKQKQQSQFRKMLEVHKLDHLYQI